MPVGTRELSRKLHLCVGVSRLVTHIILAVILASSVLLLLEVTIARKVLPHPQDQKQHAQFAE